MASASTAELATASAPLGHEEAARERRLEMIKQLKQTDNNSRISRIRGEVEAFDLALDASMHETKTGEDAEQAAAVERAQARIAEEEALREAIRRAKLDVADAQTALTLATQQVTADVQQLQAAVQQKAQARLEEEEELLKSGAIKAEYLRLEEKMSASRFRVDSALEALGRLNS